MLRDGDRLQAVSNAAAGRQEKHRSMERMRPHRCRGIAGIISRWYVVFIEAWP
jgi:hypothetical protein